MHGKTKDYINAPHLFPFFIHLFFDILQTLIEMALSPFSNFFLLFISMSVFAYSAFARDFSIVGYSPDDLTSMDKLTDLFESWMSKHGKSYRSFEEKLHRFEVFQDNLKHIDETNKKVSSYWLGLNEFADLSHEEFKSKYLGLKIELPKRRDSPEEFSYKDVADLPKSVDWRKKGAVAHVKNQGACGKCPYTALMNFEFWILCTYRL